MSEFWKATAIRCARTFLTTIAGCWTAGTLITDLDWKSILLGAFSATVYIFILCLIAGIPEVQPAKELTEEEVNNAVDVVIDDSDIDPDDIEDDDEEATDEVEED